MTSTRPGSSRKITGFVSTVDYVTDSDGDSSEDNDRPSARTRKRKQSERTQYIGEDDEDEDGSDDDIALVGSDEDDFASSSRRGRKPRGVKAKASRHGRGDDEDDDDDILDSDIYGPKKRKRKHLEPSRHSARTTRHVGAMQEIEIDDIFRSESDEPRGPAKPKPTSTREIFKPLPRNDEFRMRHNQFCDVCNQTSVVGPLIDCQGCSLAYHKSCLGHRTSREHLVTKIGEDEFVLQCRRCIAFPRKKDPTAPDQGKCQECREHGLSCRPFRRRTTPAQEQKAREENGGIDPIYPIDPVRINNVDNVLFRCLQCYRGFHYNHLPSRSGMMDLEMEVDAEQRFREYSRDWKCRDCVEATAKVSGIIAWKPIDEDAYDPTTGIDGIEEDEVVYLVRWEGMSYFRARWMPGAWVWGVTSASMRKAFAKREDAQHPKMRLEDAIPEDYLRTDIVLDIKYTSIVDIHTEEIDKARIREVEKALIKYKGLGYEDAVWEAPPTPDDGERWTDFVMAYNDLVAGRYIRQPKGSALKARLEKARNQDFATLEKKTQPENLEGGKLMDYQIEGLNWLYYKWHSRNNAILADEMGLGKTIQIIGFIATMVQDWNCFPFLVVVPNSTCPNWRREIKRWAPSLRVVAYYGSKESRDLAYRYELYPDGSKDLRCHIVVTSYDAAADDNCRRFFRGVSWQGLIVDEGQRLKNDKNLLYSALEALKAPFKILLTGTPLQNNQRELFNLLHFLDDSFNAEELEAEYEELDPQKVAKLHDMIRPFFLRRTKVQVLTFLPPMAQIIVPVSMTIVQKKLYKSILAKNPDLMRAIFSAESTTAKSSEKSGLNNILMQLRKCLCHPFVYNRGIEDKNVSIAASHRNLVDASSKLKLLELLLPKLKQRGHRVLIFSQFLDMLDMVEDFLDGMELRYQRLDGSISSLQKQKRIDEFNAEGSPLFAFLLSTRAGGVGINLATADTVIILDPDFNPHQDIQALARAHRIGQKKKVLCFQLVTRASAEERIMQIGRKKLALEHVLIRQMDNTEEADETDITSVLRHGVSELFEGNGEQDITYDSSSIERLLDRSHMEDTEAGEAQSAENQFSFARVWANDQGALQDADLGPENEAPDPGVWANILRERERLAAEEAAANAEALGRGRRARQNVDYAGDLPKGPDDVEDTSAKRRGKREGDDSDTDFQAGESEADDDGEDEGENGAIGNDEMSGLVPSASPAKPKKPGKNSNFHITTQAAVATTVKPTAALNKNPRRPRVKAASRGPLNALATPRGAVVKQGRRPRMPTKGAQQSEMIVPEPPVVQQCPHCLSFPATERGPTLFTELVVYDLGEEGDNLPAVLLSKSDPMPPAPVAAVAEPAAPLNETC